MKRSWSVIVGWMVVLVVGVVAGHTLGSGMLAVPGVEVAAWRAWAATTDPLVAVMALLRVAALAAGWYLLVATALGVGARAFHAVRLVRFADRISAPIVRRVLQRGMGAMVATALVTSVPAPEAQAAEPPPVAVLQDGPSTLTMRGVSPEIDRAQPRASHDAVPPWQRFLDLNEPRAPERIVEDRATHTVRAGESLWRIAEIQLAAVLGREPRDAEVVPYWRDLIERNRDRLIVADDPDLIVPGQEFLLPQMARP